MKYVSTLFIGVMMGVGMSIAFDILMPNTKECLCNDMPEDVKQDIKKMK